jgi:hypothetical protein
MQKRYSVHLLMLSLMVAFSMIAAVPAFSQTSTVYNSIPKTAARQRCQRGARSLCLRRTRRRTQPRREYWHDWSGDSGHVLVGLSERKLDCFQLRHY